MTMIARYATLFAALGAMALTACQAEEANEREDAAPAEPAADEAVADEPAVPEPSTPASLLEEAGLDGAAVSLEGDALFQALEPAEGLEIEQTQAGVMVSGEMANSGSGGRTGGARIVLDAATARELTGSRITITVIARSPDGAGLRAAYSTAQFGNSGWNDLELDAGFAPVSFQYDLPAGEDVNEDYIGLAPQGGSVEIAALAVSAAD
ncbi:MAG: hypothetical protein RKE49_01535 [Oceanicaulis sp.]